MIQNSKAATLNMKEDTKFGHGYAIFRYAKILMSGTCGHIHSISNVWVSDPWLCV